MPSVRLTYLPENRDNFPGWTDSTEFDYYRWHFAETLPAVGWQRLNHRTRWIPFRNNREYLDSLHGIYASIPLETRRRADTLVAEGISLRSTDTTTAAAKWEEALSLSPYHQEGLLELHDYFRFVAGDTGKTRELFDRLRLVRGVNDFATIDTVNRELGEVVGFWHREEISKNTEFFASWTWLEWDVTGHVLQSGRYDASFYYTDGFKQLEIDSVMMFEDGSPVSLDVHTGVSGNVMSDITYGLAVPEYKPGSAYKLGARVKGGGGVDTYGQVHFKYDGPLSSMQETISPAAGFELSQSYPNPFNPATVIPFTLHRSLFTTLRIYNALGQEVAVLVDEELGAGSYRISWYASGFPSGVYFYRLQAGEFIETRKLVLLR